MHYIYIGAIVIVDITVVALPVYWFQITPIQIVPR